MLPTRGTPAENAPAAENAPPAAMDAPAPADPRVEILWDEWGVPHIFADDATALFYANGWAMMHNHANLVLRLYGHARGRAAEYWGARYLESDVWVRTNDIPARAARWYDGMAPHARAYLEAFVAGMNAYARHNRDAIADELRQVLPVTAADVLAHQQRVVNFTFMTMPAMPVIRAWRTATNGTGQDAAHAEHAGHATHAADAAHATNAARTADATNAADAAMNTATYAGVPGSNAWAVAPSRTQRGNALLLMNPHLPWEDLFTLTEVHLVTPELNFFGTALVGLPGAAMGFNEHLGWAHTVNTIDAADLYRLTVQGNSYILDGIAREFDVRVDTLYVLQPDLSRTARPLIVRRSVHGPVVAERNGQALALRVAGLDAANLLAQQYDMMRATDRTSFEIALARLQLPMYTVMYADRHGDIMHVFNGAVPVRTRGDWTYWQGAVPADSSSTLWTRVHDYATLPRVVNPVSGWLQNANDPPWTTTFPPAIDPAFYPPYMAPQRPMAFRPIRSARMLAESPRLTLERMIELKHSTRMQAADHLVSDIVAAARSLDIPGAREAADILERWDRTAGAESRGALLFANFYRAMARQRWPTGSMFEIPWTPAAPLATPDGLADPRRAVEVLAETAAQLRAAYGSLDPAWGDVHRLRRDGMDLPGHGGGGDIGIFRVVDYEPIPGDSMRFEATGGDSFVAAVEFSQPVRAFVLTAYGNSSQPGSPHRADQLPLFARQELRPVRMTREDVLPHVVRRETF
jgi:acyl-homoserine-lactone acylase